MRGPAADEGAAVAIAKACPDNMWVEARVSGQCIISFARVSCCGCRRRVHARHSIMAVEVALE